MASRGENIDDDSHAMLNTLAGIDSPRPSTRDRFDHDEEYTSSLSRHEITDTQDTMISSCAEAGTEDIMSIDGVNRNPINLEDELRAAADEDLYFALETGEILTATSDENETDDIDDIDPRFHHIVSQQPGLQATDGFYDVDSESQVSRRSSVEPQDEFSDEMSEDSLSALQNVHPDLQETLPRPPVRLDTLPAYSSSSSPPSSRSSSFTSCSSSEENEANDVDEDTTWHTEVTSDTPGSGSADSAQRLMESESSDEVGIDQRPTISPYQSSSSQPSTAPGQIGRSANSSVENWSHTIPPPFLEQSSFLDQHEEGQFLNQLPKKSSPSSKVFDTPKNNEESIQEDLSDPFRNFDTSAEEDWKQDLILKASAKRTASESSSEVAHDTTEETEDNVLKGAEYLEQARNIIRRDEDADNILDPSSVLVSVKQVQTADTHNLGWSLEQLRDPQRELQRQRNRQNLDVCDFDDTGEIESREITPEAEGVDYAQLDKLYARDTIQLDGYNTMKPIDDKIMIVEQNLGRLLALRKREASRDRALGMGVAKGKLFRDFHADRMRFTAVASDKESTGLGNGSLPRRSKVVELIDTKLQVVPRRLPDIVIRMDELGKSKEKLSKLTTALEFKNQQIILLQAELSSLDDKAAGQKNEIDELNKECDELADDRDKYIDVAEQRTNASNETIARLNKEILRSTELQEQINTEKAKVRDLGAKLQELQIALDGREVDQTRLNADLETERDSRLVTHNEMIVPLQKKEDEHHVEEIAALQSVIESLSKKLSGAEWKLVERENQYAIAEAKLWEEFNVAKESLQNKNTIQQAGNELKEEIRLYKKKIRDLEQDIILNKSEIENFKNEIASKAAIIDDMQADLGKALQEIESFLSHKVKNSNKTDELATNNETLASAQVEINDQYLDEEMEKRATAAEIEAKRVRELEATIFKLECEKEEREAKDKIKAIEREGAERQIRRLEGDLIYVTTGRENDFMGQITLPSYLSSLVTDAIEMDPERRREKYRQKRLKKALQLERQFEIEWADVREQEQVLRDLGFDIVVDERDSEYPRSLFEKQKLALPSRLPWNQEVPVAVVAVAA